jgi:hypothetical protein
MKYLLESRGDDYFGILNDDSDSYVGYVALRGARYHVRNDESEEIAVVKSLDEVIPAFAAHYEANPPRWERESDDTMRYADMAPCRARYIKETQFDPLWVDKIKPGQWLAYRNGHELLIDGGQIAIFATCEEAQRAADAHLRDGYPNSETIDDGFSWLPGGDPSDIDWRLCPYRTAARARLAVA